MNRPPAMHRILADERVTSYEADVGRERIKSAVEHVLGRVRLSGEVPDLEAVVAALLRDLDRLRLISPRPVINATGIILHTNLGRAPLASDASDAIAQLAGRYSNLEIDLESGERGSRYDAVAGLLRDLTGAEDVLIVNNCAAALLLVLDTLAKGREVVVARNQLVEIGGGLRIPEVLERSGATLVEVGTTNRVYIEDHERALSAKTTLLLRTHASNYHIEGFAHETSGAELAALGRRAGVVVAEDLGSGALVDLAEYGIAHERTVQEALGDGVGIVTFSGDKLLGGPQCGIIVGRAPLIARLRNNPLLRALRVGSLTLAALTTTLRCYRDANARKRLPLFAMLGATLEQLRERAASYVRALPEAKVVESDAYAGGGSLPESRIASIAVALASPHAEVLAGALRRGQPTVVARIETERVLLDLRTVMPDEDASVISAIATALHRR